MEPTTFSVKSCENSNDELNLVPCSQAQISDAMWEELAANMAGVRKILAYPAAILAQRCREGYSAVTVSNGRIVHYLSFAPIVRHATGACTWASLAAGLHGNPTDLPEIDVFELATAWTDPAWRRKGINYAIRRILIERHLNSTVLGLCGTAGSRTPLNTHVNWQVLAWDVAPFVSSLMAVPAADFPAQAAMGWRTPEGLTLYLDAHDPLSSPDFRWERTCCCWVSDQDLATDLNQKLAALVHGDLMAWRSILVAAFTAPDSIHKLAFLS